MWNCTSLLFSALERSASSEIASGLNLRRVDMREIVCVVGNERRVAERALQLGEHLLVRRQHVGFGGALREAVDSPLSQCLSGQRNGKTHA